MIVAFDTENSETDSLSIQNAGSPTPSLPIAAPRNASAENVVLAALFCTAGSAVVYALASMSGFVGNWPAFVAGVERLLH